ncbi:SCO2522 family protein [Nocardia arizonensis]|uniref:SCO2522 family protein n=1 Tax=Nocardia arizonensis TaxID=1141647 RepID=UPI0006CFA152|nr:SCO2522 family protein [Nocardia arizonensis]
MIGEAAGYSEDDGRPGVERIPLSHLSIEVGHFYLDDVMRQTDRVRAEFARLAPVVAAFVESARQQYGPGVRISTCYLIDDYFRPETDPVELIENLLGAAEQAGTPIDYLARQSGCDRIPRDADREPIPVADMVAATIVPEPLPPDAGGRRATADSGWLCNGRRSSEHDPARPVPESGFRPPEEFGGDDHSVFLDVQLWSRQENRTRWSRAFLGAVWYLLRLGMLRYHGRPVIHPRPRPRTAPLGWDELPAVMRVNPNAMPFAAYRTLSILPARHIGVEHAVRMVLEHLDLDDEVVDQIVACGAQDGVPVPRPLSDRLSHLILDGS